HLPRSDEGLAIREEDVSARLADDAFEAEIPPAAEEISIRDRCRSKGRELSRSALHRRVEAGRTGDSQVLAFFDGNHHVAIANRRSDLLAVDGDAVENTKAIEIALRLEDRGVAERIAVID